MATIVPTTRGKLTLDTTNEGTKVASIISYLKAEPDVDVTNGLGFAALTNRITAVKCALGNPHSMSRIWKLTIMIAMIT